MTFNGVRMSLGAGSATALPFFVHQAAYTDYSFPPASDPKATNLPTRPSVTLYNRGKMKSTEGKSDQAQTFTVDSLTRKQRQNEYCQQERVDIDPPIHWFRQKISRTDHHPDPVIARHERLRRHERRARHPPQNNGAPSREHPGKEQTWRGRNVHRHSSRKAAPEN